MIKDHEIITVGDFEFISTKEMPLEEWVKCRDEGLGGSDNGTILGLNPYASITELFYQRLGLTPPVNLEDNENVFFGHRLEPIIRDLAQYYDFFSSDRKEYIKNFSSGKRLRSVIEVPYMIRHASYPHMLLNLDGMGYEGQDVTVEMFEEALRGGEILFPDLVSEIKTITQMASDKWESGVPPGYVAQVTGYMIPFVEHVPDIYASILSLQSGVELEGKHIPFDVEFAAQIVVETKRFWTLLVETRGIVNQMVSEGYTEDDINQYVDSVAPVPEGATPSYIKFLSKRLQLREVQTGAGTDEVYELALDYKSLKQEQKTLQDKINDISAKVKRYMLKENARILSWEDGRGRISFGRNNALYMNIKKV